MKQFIKDGQIAGDSVIINGRQIFNPTEDMLIEAGYTEYVPEPYTPEPIPQTNEDIRRMREDAYRMRSDSLFIAYNKYLALGEEDKAEAAKQQWLAEIAMIDAEYPYIENNE